MPTNLRILTQRWFLLILIIAVVALVGVGIMSWIIFILNPSKHLEDPSRAEYITVADSSGNENHGGLIGEPYSVNGKFGLGLGFDGADDFVFLGDVYRFEDQAPFTAAFWVKDSGASGSFDRLVSKEFPAEPREGWLIFRHNKQAKYGFERWEGGVPDRVYIPYPTRRWNHVAFSYDGSSLKGYLNGKLAARPVPSSNRVQPSFDPLEVGTGGGELDELRIYDRALSDEEIAKLAQGLAKPDQSYPNDPVGYWTFDELLTGAQ